MVYCSKRKIIFIHIPKNAGTSFEHYLGLTGLSSGHGIKNGKAQHHFLWPDYKSRMGETYDIYFKFTICRNPYMRFISVYNWCRIPGQGARAYKSIDNFIDFCEKRIKDNYFTGSVYDDHIIPQYKFVYDDEDNLMVDYVGRFENLDETVQVLEEKFDIKKKFPHMNKDGRKRVLSEEQKERIYNLYKKDFELFGYEK